MNYDCTVSLTFNAPTLTSGGAAGSASGPQTFRGILVDNNRRLLSIQTDSGTAVSTVFTQQWPDPGIQ